MRHVSAHSFFAALFQKQDRAAEWLKSTSHPLSQAALPPVKWLQYIFFDIHVLHCTARFPFILLPIIPIKQVQAFLDPPVISFFQRNGIPDPFFCKHCFESLIICLCHFLYPLCRMILLPVWRSPPFTAEKCGFRGRVHLSFRSRTSVAFVRCRRIISLYRSARLIRFLSYKSVTFRRSAVQAQSHRHARLPATRSCPRFLSHCQAHSSL